MLNMDTETGLGKLILG